MTTRSSRPSTERRIAPRFQVRVPVEFQGDILAGSGMSWDISTSGARIERASVSVEPGTVIEIRFSFFPGSFENAFPAEGVRRTQTGFAVRFRDLNEAQLGLLRSELPAAAQSDPDLPES